MTTPLVGPVVITSPGAPSTNVTSPAGGTVLTSPGLPGPPGSGVQLDGAVATYSALPSNLGPSDAGSAYVVQANGKLYVWSGTAWPTEANGADFRGEVGPIGPVGPKGEDSEVPGPQGEPGVSITAGSGPPAAGAAAVGTLYVDTNTGDIYRYN